jgi:solute carrier family 35, member E1
VAFANVVKSGEPFVFVLVGIAMGQGIPKAMECAALVPIIAGVAIASMAEPEFSALAFGCAMLSNFLFGGRATFAKALMKSDKNPSGMSGSDLFAMNTVFAFLLMAPITFVLEGKAIKAGFDKLCTGKPAALDYMALANGVLEPVKGKALGPTPEYFIAYQLVCGLYYYFYNELAFVVLDMLDAVSQAVANTVKRVVVIIAGTIIFAKPMTTNGIVGSSVAIAGVLLYSLVKSGAFDKKKIEAKKA